MPVDPLGSSEVLQVVLLAAIVAATLALAVKQARDLKALERKVASKKRYVTVIDCGGSDVKRDFREGDYVGARVSECDGREGIVKAIYVEEPKPEKQGEVKSPRGTGSISRGG